MLILPNQAGVVLGLFAFAVASLVSVFSGVTLETAIIRGGVAFLIFLVFGWLMAYIIYDEEKPETKVSESTEVETEAPVEVEKVAISTGPAVVAMPEPAATVSSTTSAPDAYGLEAPDDSDF